MADFTTTASAAVTLLQELETAADSAGEKFIASVPQIQRLATRSKQEAQEVEQAVDALEQRVGEIRQEAFSRVDALKEKLAQLYFKFDGIAQSIDTPMGEHESKISELDGALEQQGTDIRGLTDDTVKQVEVTKEELDESNKAMKTDLDAVEEQLEKSQEVLVKMQEAYDREQQELKDFAEDRIIKPTTENTNHAETELRSYASEWRSQMNAPATIVDYDIQGLVDFLNEEDQKNRQEVEAMRQNAEQSYDTGRIDAAEAKVQETAQSLNNRFQQSETLFNESADKTEELQRVMQKMVS